MIEKNTNLGSVNISLDVVSTVAGGAATECYGVVGMASQKKLKDGFYELLKKENFSKGIIASDGETGLILDLYIILGYGIKINEILVEVQKKLKDGFYELLKKENFSKGIIASDGETGLILDLYIILGYGIKINEILVEVQKKVKYVVESTLDVNVEAVNVYVQGLRNID